MKKWNEGKGRAKDSVSEEWYDEGFLKNRFIKNNKSFHSQTAEQNTNTSLLQTVYLHAQPKPVRIGLQGHLIRISSLSRFICNRENKITVGNMSSSALGGTVHFEQVNTANFLDDLMSLNKQLELSDQHY